MHRLAEDIHFNQNRKLQKHIQQSTVCLQWHSFLRYNVAHCTILLSQQQFGHMHTHVHTHTDRLSICVGNDSPPPPGVEPSLSRLLPLHLCEPFTSLHSLQFHYGSISIIQISCNHSQRHRVGMAARHSAYLRTLNTLILY